MKFYKNIIKYRFVFLFLLLSIVIVIIYLLRKYSFNSKHTNIILCSINIFQDYILDNINQLIKLGHKNIYVLTNAKYFDKFDAYKNQIILIDCDEFDVTDNKSEDFWKLTSTRFFYVCGAMKKYGIRDVIHIENDVLLYYNADVLLDKVDEKYIYIPFDSFERNIASIMYIPDYITFENALKHYDFSKNDMLNFKGISVKTNLVQHFPIFINNHNDHVENQQEYEFVTQNFDKFNYIFDAAAIGQYIGGTHQDTNAIGFINETCVIKFNNYTFDWIIENNIRKPIINIDNKKYRIFNLHIHSKNLQKFV